MFEPLLLTKLYAPPPRPDIVHRSRLIERLNEGLSTGRKLTLISAPAGFGKTTLVSEWIAGCVKSVAWLSLDEGDNNTVCFLSYLIAALQTIESNIGAGVLAVLQSPQQPPPEASLTILLNEISAIQDSFILVLDDYHVIDSKPVDQLLAFLVEHLPTQLHLVIATREDPPLLLARLRARGQLTELRASDLRFTPSEAADFLNRMMGLKLSSQDITALEVRTEGWVAGLQLAALSMRERSDTANFIQAFTGSHRFVLDYLVGEVLERQPERVRNYLLQTSVLDRLCVSLCNAVTECEDAKELLDVLERSNLFLIPLDDNRQWYRYHHLFADVLRAHLKEAQPEQVSSLHIRASAWYEQNRLQNDAIRHSLAAGDFEHAAALIESAWSVMDHSYQSSTWLIWVKALPYELIRTRPVLSVGYAWALLDSGDTENSETYLKDAEYCLDTPKDKMVVVDKVQFLSLPASIATARAFRSLTLGDVSDTVKYARHALELRPEDDQIRYIQATSLLGIAQYTNGNLKEAARSLADCYEDLQETDEIQSLIGITFLMADISVALGCLHKAESIYQQSIPLASSQGESVPLGTADLYRGLGELYIEWNDLDTAAQQLLIGQKVGEQISTTNWLHRLCVSQACLREAQGDLDGALGLLDEAERVHVRGPLPEVRPVAALKVRVWLKQGRLAEAQGWVRDKGLAVNDDMRFMHEFEHTTLARVLIATGKSAHGTAALDDASLLLGRLLQAAETESRVGSIIQILLLQALVLQAQNKLPQALASLERALALAEPEGYVRIFVDEGEAMRMLFVDFRSWIEKQSGDRTHPLREYVDKLIAAFEPFESVLGSITKNQQSELIEPLTQRELEVLQLICQGLSNQEICQRLFLALDTVKGHNRRIFEKLLVHRRTEAIARARELNLF